MTLMGGMSLFMLAIVPVGCQLRKAGKRIQCQMIFVHILNWGQRERNTYKTRQIVQVVKHIIGKKQRGIKDGRSCCQSSKKRRSYTCLL